MTQLMHNVLQDTGGISVGEKEEQWTFSDWGEGLNVVAVLRQPWLDHLRSQQE